GIGLAAAPPAVGASGGTAGIAAEIAAEDGGGAAAPVRGAGATRWADPEPGPGYTERMLSPWGSIPDRSCLDTGIVVDACLSRLA
ncbi:hypothetical protein, partial [Methylobacterium radiotolerans]|uniref:hypothetical protein n=1 Tax=Methylobacterium radiotolerans TaxID=31998 RepID=UPI001AECF52E